MGGDDLNSSKSGNRRRASFFAVSTSALNLAIFRIAVFGGLLYVGGTHPNHATWFSSVPEVLRVAPPGWEGALRALIPSDPVLVASLHAAFLVSATLAMIGQWTRVTTWLAVITGLITLGLPQFFGKLNHFHHLWWFGLLLATSPCSDALSLDSWRRGSFWRGAPTGPEYAVPIRFVWLLIGLIYFFPGLWKLSSCGLEWILSDNLQWLLYDKWTELGGFLPFWRIDRVPLAYRTAALGTILFEICFLPALLVPRLRGLAVMGGLLFHWSTWVFMGINFVLLLICYVAFIDWAAVLRSTTPQGPSRPVAKISPTGPRRRYLVQTTVAGSLLLVANGLCGTLGVDSWPFAVYPRFDYFQGTQRFATSITIRDNKGHGVTVDDSKLRRRLSPSRYSNLTQRVARRPSPALLAGFTELLLDNTEVEVEGELVVWRETLAIHPERWATNPLSREPLWIVDLGTPGDCAGELSTRRPAGRTPGVAGNEDPE